MILYVFFSFEIEKCMHIVCIDWCLSTIVHFHVVLLLVEKEEELSGGFGQTVTTSIFKCSLM